MIQFNSLFANRFLTSVASHESVSRSHFTKQKPIGAATVKAIRVYASAIWAKNHKINEIFLQSFLFAVLLMRLAFLCKRSKRVFLLVPCKMRIPIRPLLIHRRDQSLDSIRFALVEYFLHKFLHEFSIVPGSRIKSITRATLSIYDELFEIPNQIRPVNFVVEEAFCVAQRVAVWWARFLKWEAF